MDLNDLLLQQQEVTNLLSNLQEAHKRILISNEDENNDLNKIRKDILICLNDLKTVNSLMIDPRDGLIKKNLHKLEKYDQQLRSLDSEEAAIESNLNQWKIDQDPENVRRKDNWGTVPINLVGNHQCLLESYVDEVGIENTTLANTNGNHEETPNSSKFTREQLLRNARKLKLCQDQVNSEIDQLKSLINQYERDRNVINDEYNRTTELIQKEVNTLSREEDKINSQREKILKKLGLLKDHEQNQPRNLFFSLGALARVDNSDFKIALSQAYEFIDAKKQALKKILHENKSQTMSLEHNFSIWNDVIRSIQGLETDLQQSFIEKEGNVPKTDITSMISRTLSHVNSIVGTYSKDSIFTSILCEVKALQKALDELNGKIQPIPIKSSAKTPELLQMGKSPPKVALSKEYASNLHESTEDFPVKVNKTD
ncbi:Atg23 [Kluyveromyces lactis]|nr:Atg23 [Kluyveromyces lactis]